VEWQLANVKRAGTALFGVVETETWQTIGGRNSSRVEFLINANVRRGFDNDDAVRHGKGRTL
jgi:hypothetical protein